MEHTASDYRMMSSLCQDIANAMSLESDRVRLTAKAQEWLELAHQAEARRLPEITQGQDTGSEALEPLKQDDTTQKNLNIGDNSADEVMLDRAPASPDSCLEIVDDASGGTPCSLEGRTGADPVDGGGRNIASVFAPEASVPKNLVTQPGELDAGVQRAGSAPVAEVKIPSVPAVETSFPRPPASQFVKPNAGMYRDSHGAVTSQSSPMLTKLLLLAVFALFLTALFAAMLQ